MNRFYSDDDTLILLGDSLETLKVLPDQCVQCVVTSPPYWGLRDYGVDGQMGLEDTPEKYVEGMVRLFREVKRVLRNDGTLWLNLGDSYAMTHTGSQGLGKRADNFVFAKDRLEGQGKGDRHEKKIPSGLKPKDLVGIPWRVAFALQAEGWYLRQDIIWHKPNPMPESVRDRCTKAHEYIFLLSKSEKYWFDSDAMKESTASGESRNRRDVWTVATSSYKGAHFATFPPALIEPCILAGCPEGGLVLDPFGGSGTTAVVARKHKRKVLLLELNPEYAKLATERILQGK